MVSAPGRVMAGTGTYGLGKGMAFAHLESQVVFAYETARPGGFPDERADTLRTALRGCR